jgi:hypothetical protein
MFQRRKGRVIASWTPRVWSACLSVFIACGNDTDINDRQLNGILADSINYVAAIGRVPPSDPSGELGVIQGARIDVNSKLVAVVDAVSPHLKIFDLNGHYIKGLISTGRGPGEVELPIGPAVSNQDIVVVDARLKRLIMRNANNATVIEATLKNVIPLAATFACGDIVVYGPSQALGQTADWLRRFRVQEGKLTQIWSGFQDTVPVSVSLGKPQGLIVHDSIIVIRHDRPTESSIQYWRCSDVAALSKIAETKLGEIVAPPDDRTPGKELRRVIPAGIALVGRYLLTADLRLRTTGISTHLTLRKESGALLAETILPGQIAIADAVEGGGIVLVRILEVPEVLILRWDRLLAIFDAIARNADGGGR